MSYAASISAVPSHQETSKLGGLKQSQVQLLDEDGVITTELEACLDHIFAKYCKPPPSDRASDSHDGLLKPPVDAILTDAALDKWACHTNGSPFSKETKEELKEFLDVTDDGSLTREGFIQIYQLQTENDEEETWRDLRSHGFDRTLQLARSLPDERDSA